MVNMNSILYNSRTFYENILNKPTIQNFLLKTFNIYCQTVVNVNKTTKHIYKNNFIIRTAVDYLNYSKKYVLSILYQNRIEPIQKYWICIS